MTLRVTALCESPTVMPLGQASFLATNSIQEEIVAIVQQKLYSDHS